jgi:hypothetical protein
MKNANRIVYFGPNFYIKFWKWIREHHIMEYKVRGGGGVDCKRENRDRERESRSESERLPGYVVYRNVDSLFRWERGVKGG